MSTFQRFELVGQTPHRHEQEGIDWLRAALPTYGPFGGYGLFSFQTEDGRRYEIDAVVLTAHCLYLIEMKSWVGRVTEGDARHLVTYSKARGREVVDHPLPLLDSKRYAFMDRVKRVARCLGSDVDDALHRVRFESLVWLTHAEGTDLGDHDAARAHVIIGRNELGKALRQASFPGARDDLSNRELAFSALKALQRVLGHREFGLGKIDKPLTVVDGRFALAELVDEGDDYQDHWADPHAVGPRCRVRSYLLGPKGDPSALQSLNRRVEREANLLTRLGDHPNILALEQLDARGPLGPALVFRGFPGKTLDAFLKEHRREGGRSDVSIDDKLTILRRVADALTFCHRSDVVHRALSPDAVLVHRSAPLKPGEQGALDVKLTRFALASAGDATSDGTRLFTRLAGASAVLFQAPEVARGAPGTPESDMFSLGALAYYLLAEELPAPTAAELAQRLDRDDGLLISAVRDDLFPAGVQQNIDTVLWSATSTDPTERTRHRSTPLDLIERLEEALTAPETFVQTPAQDAPAPELDPLEAVKGSVLGGELKVLGELGSGATARVFKVDHPQEGVVALKVPLSDAHDERIAHEAEVLQRLRRTPGVDRIAHFIDVRTIAGRTCLLVQLAGDRTLGDEIRAEGALSLDYARRWGEDLLTALRSLEEAGVQHRDIKPANIGLTSGAEKGRKRLLLFDFSLSQRPATELATGTPAYKDPELAARGRWDDAADRWAAAVTLHEMFTGVRPAPIAPAGPGSLAARIEADRLDADVRDGLLQFFERAFRYAARERFATAEDMRDAFIRALHKVPAHEGRADDEPLIGLADLKGLEAGARVGDLPLSTRQRNALDRMGIYTLQELGQVSSNRIGGVRGVGAKTARSLVELAARVRDHLEISTADVVPVFFRGFAGARRGVEEEAGAGRLSRALARRLVEAGLADAAAVASAPHAQVKNLVTRARKDGAAESLKDVTGWLEGLVDAEQPPGTLGAAVELIAPSSGPKGGAARRRVRQYLGLEPLEGFPRHGTMHELARASGVTRALISIDIGKARERWTGAAPPLPLDATGEPPKRRELAVLERVFSAVQGALEANGAVVPIERAAAAVLEAFPPEPDLGPDAVKHAAQALVRAVTELDASLLGGPENARLQWRRIAKEPAATAAAADVLIAWDRAGLDLARRLGQAADALVAADQVVAEAAAAARLREEIDRMTDLDPRRAGPARDLPDRALCTLAIATAAQARLSARGELYPVGLSAGRAILLSAAAIGGGVSLEELQRRVRARYPDAAPLPDDPAALERLAATLGHRLAGDMLVPPERTLGLPPTELGSLRSAPLASGMPPASIPFQPRTERTAGDVRGAQAVQIFNEELERIRRDGGFRVLLWRGSVAQQGRPFDRGAPDAEVVAQTVARRTGGEMQRLDTVLIDAAEQVAVEKHLPKGLAPAIQADHRGPDGPFWKKLLDLMHLAAERAFDGLLGLDRVRVLTRVGLLGRYELLSVIARLAEAHRAPAPEAGRAATFVVLPVYTGEGAVVEVGADVASRAGASGGSCLVPVPGLLPHEILEVPSPWVERHAERRSSSAPRLQAQRA